MLEHQSKNYTIHQIGKVVLTKREVSSLGKPLSKGDEAYIFRKNTSGGARWVFTREELAQIMGLEPEDMGAVPQWSPPQGIINLKNVAMTSSSHQELEACFQDGRVDRELIWNKNTPVEMLVRIASRPKQSIDILATFGWMAHKPPEPVLFAIARRIKPNKRCRVRSLMQEWDQFNGMPDVIKMYLSGDGFAGLSFKDFEERMTEK
jgi:hypothetical protein